MDGPHPTAPADRREGGFTLIELMTVVLVIAILIAIAIPTFVGARTRATDRHAQSLLRNGLTAALVDYADTQDFTAATPAKLHRSLTELDFVDDTTPADSREQQVSVATGGAAGTSYVVLASRSASGECFALVQRGDEPPGYASTPAPTCSAGDFSATSGAWSAAW